MENSKGVSRQIRDWEDEKLKKNPDVLRRQEPKPARISPGGASLQ
jgi:hypothetical protein